MFIKKKYYKIFIVFYAFYADVMFAQKIQFFIGTGFDITFKKQELLFSNENCHYWREIMKSNYSDDFEKLCKHWENEVIDGSPKNTRMIRCQDNTPMELLDRLLNNIDSLIYDEKYKIKQLKLYLGSYIYRRENILLATEVYFCKSSYKNQKNIYDFIFNGNMGKNICATATEFEAQQAIGKILYSKIKLPRAKSAAKTSGIDRMFFYGDLQLQENIEIEEHYSYGINLKLGTIFKDRVYIFALFGLDIRNLNLKFIDEKLFDINSQQIASWFNNVNNNPLVLISTADMESYAGDKKVAFDFYAIPPKDDLSKYFIKLDENANEIGFVIGLGAEVFLSRHISVVTQSAFKVYAKSKFGEIISGTSKNLGLTVGLSYRF